jgi:hypothetical protein
MCKGQFLQREEREHFVRCVCVYVMCFCAIESSLWPFASARHAWADVTPVDVLVDTVLRDRPEDKRREWTHVLVSNELGTIADLRALQASHWVRLGLPVGVEQALQQVINMGNRGQQRNPSPIPFSSASGTTLTNAAAASSVAAEGHIAEAAPTTAAKHPAAMEERLKGSITSLSKSITAVANKARTNLSSSAKK